MPEAISNSLADDFVERFTNYSKLLKRGKFTKERIGKDVFSGDNSKRRYFEHFGKGKNVRPLDAAALQMALDACRNRLRAQLKLLGVANPDRSVAEFEKTVCVSLHFAGTAATIEDFLLDCRDPDQLGPEDFGIPDLVAWPTVSFDFMNELTAAQDRSIRALDEILQHIRRHSDPGRRLSLLRVAFAVATLNHPGTPGHSLAFDRALEAAGHAQLLQLTNGSTVADDLRHQAVAMTVYLHSLRFLPTFSSPANVMHYALAGTSLPEDQWNGFRHNVEAAVLATDELVRLDPGHEYSQLSRAALLSQNARLLLATGNAGNVREADRLERLSRWHIERLSTPYGHLYPVQRQILKGRFKDAIRTCEAAIVENERAGNSVSAAGFGALHFQLSHLAGRGPTKDRGLRELAQTAIRSHATRYRCSHVFCESAVRKLLSQSPRTD